MTSYDAGAARAVYDLDAAPFYAEIARIKRAYQELRGLGSQAASGAQTVIPASAAPAGLRDVTPRLQAQAAAAQRAQRETLALAQAEARLSAAQGNLPAGIQRLNQALATQTERTRQVIAVETQRARLQAQQARAAQPAPAVASGAGGLGAALGGLGIGLGVVEVGQATVAAGGYAIALTQTEAVLRQLSGSQGRYNTLTRIAAENQKLFGGSLAENYAPLTGVLALSNQTGASLEQLNSVTQLLLAKAPGKQAGDAFFGLGEFLSGQGAEAALSLADQFNLSKAAIAALAAEGVSAEDRLTGLTQLLAEQGVTAATLEARLTDDARAYNALAAEAEQAYIRIGKAAAAGGRGPAQLATRTLEGLNIAADWVTTGTPRMAQADQAVLESARTYEEYVTAAKAKVAADQGLFQSTIGMIPGIGQLSAAVLGQAANLQLLNKEQWEAVKGWSDRQQAISAARDLFTSDAGSQQLEPIATAYANGKLSADQFQEAVAGLLASLRAQGLEGDAAAGGNQRAAASMDLAAAAAAAQKSALADATKAASDQANAGGDMKAQARAAADALLAAGNAGAGAAALLAGSTDQVDQMTAALYRLDAAQARTRASGREGGLVGGSDTSGLTEAQQARLEAEQSQRYQAQLQEEITRATGTTAQRLAQVNRELARATPLSEEARRLEVEKARLAQQLGEEQQAAADRRASQAQSAAKKAATEAKQAAEQEQRAREQRQNEVDRALEQIEDRTADHYRRLRQSQEDYELSASRKAEDFQLERQRLLAEGRVAEARLLEQRYSLEQRRAAEDAARARARTTEDYRGDVAKTREDAQLTGAEAARARAAIPAIPAAAVAAQAGAAQAAAVLAATAAQRPAPLLLQVQIAPTQVQIDGQRIVEITWPRFEQLVDAELAGGIVSVALTAPAGAGQGGGVGGPRP